MAPCNKRRPLASVPKKLLRSKAQKIKHVHVMQDGMTFFIFGMVLYARVFFATCLQIGIVLHLIPDDLGTINDKLAIKVRRIFTYHEPSLTA